MFFRGLFILLIAGLFLSWGTVEHVASENALAHAAKADSLKNLRDTVFIPEYIAPEPVFSANHKWDSVFSRLQKRVGFNGTVLIAEGGEVVHSGAYGYAHHKRKDTLELSSSFQLASVSKMFTAVGIMLLYEAGSLAFDEKVQTYIPEFPYEKITVRHLLNHRAGLPRYMWLAEKHWDTHKSLSNEDVLCLYNDHKPDLFFTPGTRFHYCNTNYAFLALIVERISQMPFHKFADTYIFEPLKMEDSYILDLTDKEKSGAEVMGYKRRRRGYLPVAKDFLDGVVGDKGVYSSVKDLFLLDRAFYGESLLSHKTLSIAYTGGSPELRNHNYGFGWRMQTQREGIIYHFGWWRGFRTCFIRDIYSLRTMIILSNHDNIRGNLSFWDLFCKFE